MATFAFLYFRHYVRPNENDDKIMSSMMDWTLDLQIRVFRHLADVLITEGVLPEHLLHDALQLLQPE